jgi:glycosyltransferase involved in cell wall biosynthesis
VSAQRCFRFAVVLQTPRDPHSAVYLTYQTLAAALERLGHSVEIVSPNDFALLRALSGRWVPLLYPFAIAAWMHRRRRVFDVVMFHSYAGWLATALRPGSRPRAVVMFHGVEPLYFRELQEEATAHGQPLSWRYRLLQERLMPFMLRTACRTADAVTCLNRAEADVISAWKWVPSGGLEILAHGVPAEFFVPARPMRPVRTILFVGQWLPMKGIRYLRDAAVTLLQADPSMRLVCAGTLAPEQSVRSGFPTELHPRVVVLPRVEQGTLTELYREADIFVFPSLYEAFSRAILEAMAARLAIVTTAVGVAADALRNEDNALIVPKRNAAAIVSAVRRLQLDSALAVRLGGAAAATAEEYRLEVVEPRTVSMVLRLAGAVS